MSDSMQVTASDLGALTKQYRAITHNLANANTVGYKRRISRFRRIMNDMAGEGSDTPGADHIGHGGSGCDGEMVGLRRYVGSQGCKKLEGNVV